MALLLVVRNPSSFDLYFLVRFSHTLSLSLLSLDFDLAGGPAEGKLETNDSIIRINGKDVESASNPDVISAIKY